MSDIEIVKHEETSIVTVDPQALIAQAIDKNLPIETMERLLAMRRELKAEMARDEYFKALSKFQKECPVIEKKKKVYDKHGVLRYKYAPLPDIITQIKELLEKNGFSYTIKTEQDETSVTAVCFAHHELGHEEQTKFKIPIDVKAYMNIAQKVASALTFAKRYAFCDAFGIMTGNEDDDSNFTEQLSEKNTNRNPPVQKKAKTQTGFNAAPEENRALYQAIMALFREKQSGKELFTTQEKTTYKKSADAVLMDKQKLTDIYKVINKVAADKRALIKNGG